MDGKYIHEKMFKIISYQGYVGQTRMRYHYMHITVSKSDNDNTKSWPGSGASGNCVCVMEEECKMVQPLWKTHGGF